MKTTIDLPDELLAEAKATAARRRTTLKAMVEHALRREIEGGRPKRYQRNSFIVDEQGLPLVKKKRDSRVTNEMVYKLMEELGI